MKKKRNEIKLLKKYNKKHGIQLNNTKWNRMI